MQQISRVVLAIAALATMAFMIYGGSPERAGWWLLFLPFAAWALLPYGLLAVRAERAAGHRGATTIVLVGSVLATAFGVFALYMAFVAQPDPQSGLVVLFVPVWQLVGLVPFFWLSSRLVAGEASRDRTAEGVAEGAAEVVAEVV